MPLLRGESFFDRVLFRAHFRKDIAHRLGDYSNKPEEERFVESEVRPYRTARRKILRTT